MPLPHLGQVILAQYPWVSSRLTKLQLLHLRVPRSAVTLLQPMKSHKTLLNSHSCTIFFCNYVYILNMGKRLRCRMGQHEWKLVDEEKGDDMICKFCGKEFDDDGIVGDLNERKWWEPSDAGG